MNIYADVNVKATAKNVNDFLKNKLPRLASRCGYRLTDLSSPKLSLASAHSNRTDGQEKMLINSFSIEKVVDAIYQTIYHCSEDSRLILIDRYVKYISQEQIIMSLPYEKSHYYAVLKPKALNEFADLYDYWQEKCKVDPEDRLDLHIYK